MDHIGQDITWSTPSAPLLFTGEVTNYSYRDMLARALDTNMLGENRALLFHSSKAEINFEAKCTPGSTDFLDLSSGAVITVTGEPRITTGVVVATRAVERWGLIPQPKVCTITATHYPRIIATSPAAAGTALDAFTPDQTSLFGAFPGGTVIWGTFGLSHASGVVHGLSITQELQFTEDQVSPDGQIKGGAPTGYLRTIDLELLSTDDPPVKGSVLLLPGAPAHTADYRIETVEGKKAILQGMMYTINAVWIPPFTS